jgi:hypothetical protein
MKKLAMFVEGRTERVFVERLIRLMVDLKRLRIAVFRASGGNKTPRRIKLVHQTPPGPEQEYYIQIVESQNDERVGSDVRENYEGLVRASFSMIIAIRDVYPRHTFAQVPALRSAVRYRVKTKPIDPTFVLSVMEIEAWFLAEHSHFSKLHAGLTLERIKATFGFDPSADDMQTRPCPHQDLHQIYQLEGLRYEKSARHLERTVRHLDYTRVYLELVQCYPDLKTLVNALDSFFT